MKVLKVSYCMIMVALVAWFLLSLWEIGFHNTNPDYTYHSMNLVNLMFRG